MDSDSDSDSDSDGSHVSATPPRDFGPSSPPPPSRPPLISSTNSSVRARASSSSYSKPKKKFSHKFSSSPSDANRTRIDPVPASEDAFPTFSANLPFQIRSRPSDQNRDVSAVDRSLETLPAGFFSKSASFSKIRRSTLNFDCVEDDPSPSSAPIPPPKADEITVPECSAAGWLPEELDDEAAVGYGISSAKVAKKHSNLIGSNVPLPPVKFRKCSAEGNFVKLNLKRNKRKFLNKRGGSSYSSGRRSYRKYKKKMRSESEAKMEEGVCEENGLVVETMAENNQRRESKRAKFEHESLKEAILAARDEPSDENLVKLLSLTHGYDSFRDGQLEAIKMVLSGKSTMLVLPTGAGKSLCYQLSSLILHGITLVVSPLVALMIDQLKQLPLMIHGGLFCSSQTPEEVSETLRLLQQGDIKVLFVSPERLLNAEFLSLFSANVSISLVVVDEAHCVSEWSHNFRPSYMRLRASLLKAKLNVDCVLAMTATATTTTLHAVMSALEIPSTNLIQKAPLRDNLQLSVSLSRNRQVSYTFFLNKTRMKDLLMLIKSPPFTEVRSIIVYCKFQFETDVISRYLRDNDIDAKGYHGGIPAKDRSRIQELFCTNKIRVVVATVAFGMGLDKRDVGAVIHYSLPGSLEEYVQEIGRAGRDGRSSYCHLFLEDDTYFKLRSLKFSDGVDQYTINKFLCEIFSNNKKLQGKVCSLVTESASPKFDMKEEVMFTLLTQLELGEVQFLRLLPQINVTCSLSFHKTPPDVLAERDVVVAEILKKSEMKQGEYVFDIPTVANSIGITTTDLSNQLQNLKFKGEVRYKLKDQACCYTIVEVPADLCSLSAHLTKWLSEVESCKVRKLDAMFNAATFALNSCEKLHGCCGAQHTPCLQRRILDYFNENYDNYDLPNKMGQSSLFLRADMKVFLQSNSQAKFTPRAVARIMHGIASPAYTSTMWSKTHFWGRYSKIDFQVVLEAAKAELINFVGKDAT
ncbi:ATP-dependent DNA helicase Q-like 5 [Morus notabilis]|uniref:ATP-dependent DNA helicase Q-like 5 n=1 Tax=Morus notabilis TaxID=981085 RepID=UPI000CED1A5E|nr:ATP-dependent DNA helicase Q-like 5 [Morus notabilis]